MLLCGKNKDLGPGLLDVLIIGGGPAGATTGLLLAEAGWSVGIVEKKAFPRRKVCGEFLSATNLPLLQKLGIADFYLSASGPEIHRVGLYAADAMIVSRMPPSDSLPKWGRALGREHLDTVLLKKAVQAGAKLWQPSTIKKIQTNEGFSTCTLLKDGQIHTISAPVIIMANGSWERDLIQDSINPHKASDLLAFKAHFLQCDLPSDLMSLIAFPGGYGGLVHTDSERVTLSCCIRRDALQRARNNSPGVSAGEAVLHHILNYCLGVRKTLQTAKRQGNWLAAGPIKPGIRRHYHNGVFFVGNSAGEAHPVVAEGISMAMQSGWLLAQILTGHRGKINKSLGIAGDMYAKRWKQHFTPRIHAAALFAHLAMRPWSHHVILPIIKSFPTLLTSGARLSGKIQQVVPID